MPKKSNKQLEPTADALIEANSDSYGIKKASSKVASVTVDEITIDADVYTSAVSFAPPGGQIVWYYNGPPGARVSVNLDRIINSGGHYHASSSNYNSVGRVVPNSFVLSGTYPQQFRVVHQLPPVSGSIKMISNFSIGNPNSIITQTDVLIQGLVPITSSISLRLKPPRPEHSSPYWAHPTFLQKLMIVANSYYQQRDKSITVTDASLQWGGLFDLNRNWLPPHNEHRDGHQADLRSNDMTPDDKIVFRALCSANGLEVLIESDHWHVLG